MNKRYRGVLYCTYVNTVPMYMCVCVFLFNSHHEAENSAGQGFFPSSGNFASYPFPDLKQDF